MLVGKVDEHIRFRQAQCPLAGSTRRSSRSDSNYILEKTAA